MPTGGKQGWAREHARNNWPGYALVALLLTIALAYQALQPRQKPAIQHAGRANLQLTQQVSGALPKLPEFKTAPNGERWPAYADYVAGYPKLQADGNSQITVDNRGNASDVFVQLLTLDARDPYVVRHVYVPAHDSFTLINLTPGSYQIQYQHLANAMQESTLGFRMTGEGGWGQQGFERLIYTLNSALKKDMPIDVLAQTAASRQSQFSGSARNQR